MTETTTHRLTGLEPDNILAFLALLGLLRSLEAARPNWKPRVYWEGAPVRPLLMLAEPACAEDVAQASADGCEALSRDYEFGGEVDLTFVRDKARSLSQDAIHANARGRAAVMDCLFSDGAVRGDGRILASPLCAMFGQGHQHFLKRLNDVPKGVLPKHLLRRKPAPDLNTASKIADALFAPWERADETDGFRWDPAEDRRYALRFKDPSTERGCTVHGANRLAAIGLPSLPGAAVERRGRMRFLVLGTDLDDGGAIQVSWPIWDRPVSLAGLRALLGHPSLQADTPDLASLCTAGVWEVRRARRITVGKYFNFTRAEAVLT